MIPIPPPVCLGQKITVDGYNQLLDVMRALQPIGGAGILLEETSNGIIFKLAEPPQSVSTGAFNHRWKVTLMGNEEDGFKLHIAPGDLYLITDTGAVRQFLFLGDNLEDDEDRGGWITKVGAITSGTHRLAIVCTKEGGYKLTTDDLEEDETMLYIIASIKGPSSSNTTPSFTQLLYQDLYYWQGGEDDADPSKSRTNAWMMRVVQKAIEGSDKTTHHLEIFAPIWVTGMTERLATYGEQTLIKGWNDLGPLHDGAWYAALRNIPAETDDYGTTTPAQTTLALLTAKPTEHLDQYTLVHIATLAGNLLTQYHRGTIVERLNSSSGGWQGGGTSQTIEVVSRVYWDAERLELRYAYKTITAPIESISDESSRTIIEATPHTNEHYNY